MQKTKSFIQYKGDSFSIRFNVGIKGNVIQKNNLDLYGEYSRERSKKWDENNKERKLQRSKEWRKNNKDYYTKNKKKILLSVKKYRENNKEKRIKSLYKWRKDNPEKYRAQQYRHKNYGFKPLNDYFEGAHFHHLHIDNNEDGIFMPGHIHNSIWHSPNNKDSMNKINKVAFEYLEKQ